MINVNLNTENSNYSFEQQKSHGRWVALLIQTAAQKTRRQESLTSNSYKLESVGLIGSLVFRIGATHRQPYSKKITVSGWARSTRASSPPPLRDSQSMSVLIKTKLHLQTFMRILSNGNAQTQMAYCFHKTEATANIDKRHQCSTNSQMYHKESSE